MAVIVNLYTFAKKDNSTAQPTGDGTKVSGEFKTGFNLLAPVVKLYDITGTPGFNYAKIADLSRYYFITSWSYDGGFWYASLACDVLASWKSDIGAQTLYVTRSASSYDEYIIDSEYPATGQCTILEGTASGEPFGSTSGCYIVGIVGGANSTGAISYYAFTPAAFQALVGAMLGDNLWLNINTAELSDELQKALINPAQYISSCLWIPVDAGSVPGSGVGSIPVGWWSFAASASQIQPLSAKVGGSYSVAIPKHPQATARGKYLNLSPYSEYTLYFFPFGTLAIDSLRLQDQSTLNLRYVMDCCTGEAVLYITCGGDPIKVVTGRFGVPVPTGQISVQIGGLTSMAATAGMTAAAGAVGHAKDFLGGAKNLAYKMFNRGGPAPHSGTSRNGTPIERTDIKGAVNNIMSAAVASLATVDYSGQLGSNIYGVVPVTLVGKFLSIADDDNASKGRPLCSRVQLNTLSGYILCADADIEIGCTADEREAIISYLLGGFFYE